MRLPMVAFVGLVFLAAAAPASAAVYTGQFEELSPVFTSFVLGMDFNVFGDSLTPPAVGDATGLLQAAGFGNVMSEFVGFVPGNIALMERSQPISFSTKILNAEAAGAAAAIIYNNARGRPPSRCPASPRRPSR